MSLELGRHSQYLSVSILLGGEEASAFLSDGGWRRPRSGLQPSPWSLSLQRRRHGAALQEARPALTRRSLSGAALPPLSPAPSACGGGRSPVSLSGDPASQEFWGSSPLNCLLFCVPGLHFCSPGWDAFQGACYKHFSTEGAGRRRRTECRMYGAHLASISTPEEQDFINSGLGTGRRRPSSPVLSSTHSLTHQSVKALC